MICGGGQIPDLRASSVCINGRVVIDKNRNYYGNIMRCKKLKSKTIDVETLLVNGNVFDGSSLTELNVDCIKENTVGSSVLIDTPIFKNLHGVGRIYLNNFVKIENNDETVVLQGGAWSISYQSLGNGPNLLLIENNELDYPLFQAPENYPNICLSEAWQMIVEVDVSLTYDAINSGSPNKLELRLNKNDNPVSIVKQTINPYNITQDNISLHDTILLGPNEKLTIDITKRENNGSVGIISGSEYSWATFKVVGFINSIL